MKYALWTAQILLALVFLFTGAMKLMLPDADLAEQFPFPVLFIRFIAAAEIVGAVGLILPGLLGIRPELTPIAAAGLTVIMVGATVFTVMSMGMAMAVVPLVILLLTAGVAYGRWQSAPLAARTSERERDLMRTS
jgi:uncharacterized membrane protein YphA (DoxX/SURF4 family)